MDVIIDETITGFSTAGVDFTLAPPSYMPASILASAAAADTVIEIGICTSADPATYRRILSPRILQTGQAARIRLPPMRMNAGVGAQLVAKSDKTVNWLVASQSFGASSRVTSLRTFVVRPNVRTAIYAPNAGQRRWRVPGIVCCNPTAASSLVTLSFSRVEGTSTVYRDIAGPELVPPYGSLRLAVPQVVDADNGPLSLYANSETASIWHSYGIFLP